MQFIKLFIKITKMHSKPSTAEFQQERIFDMKKIFALSISIILILTCFAGCKAKLKNGAVITNAAGENFAAVTKADGGIQRDKAGNLLVLVTDEDGRNVKGDGGEYLTNPVALEHALVVGNRVECNEYSVVIPNGWSNANSFNGMNVTKDGSLDALFIEAKDTPVDDLMATTNSILSIMKTNYDNTVYENSAITIGDIEAQFMSVFVPDNGATPESGNPSSSYVAYIFFEQGNHSYSCRITSDRNMNDDLGEITDIIESIEFIN